MKNLKKAKQWLVGILYHEIKDSSYEIMSLTGYKNHSSVNRIAKKFGSLRSRNEARELTFKKRYGKSMSQYMSDAMRNKWEKLGDDEDSTFRDKISRTTSEGMKRFWKENRKRKNSH